MKILFLSFYYPPDLCAGSFRAEAVVEELIRHGVHVDVMTTKPNRYINYKMEAPSFEEQHNLRIYRFETSKHESGMRDQIFSFKDYALQVLNKVHKNNYQLVFCTSSRLFTGLLGSFISRKLEIPLYLDIRDLFINNMNDILSPKFRSVFNLFGKILERFSFSRANKINLVSKNFNDYVKTNYPKVPLSFFSNGIDKEFFDYDFSNFSSSNTKIVTYAGNIGEGQGLHCIIPFLAEHYSGKLYFRIIGDGGKRKSLEMALRKYDLENVEIIKPLHRIELLKFYKESDILFLHLNNYEAFKDVLPSKIFEYAATGKPIWAGLDGYSAQFSSQEITNCVIFKPCDPLDAIRAFSQLKFQNIDRGVFKNNYSRSRIVKLMVNDILSII